VAEDLHVDEGVDLGRAGLPARIARARSFSLGGAAEDHPVALGIQNPALRFVRTRRRVDGFVLFVRTTFWF
jgi:hypothetical protein